MTGSHKARDPAAKAWVSDTSVALNGCLWYQKSYLGDSIGELNFATIPVDCSSSSTWFFDVLPVWAHLGNLVEYSYSAGAPKMGPWPVKAHIDPARWCVVVGSPSPRRAAASKGTGVHWLKGDASWVQNVVRQFGRYLVEVLAD